MDAYYVVFFRFQYLYVYSFNFLAFQDIHDPSVIPTSFPFSSYSGLGLGGAGGLPGVLPAVRSRGADSAVKLSEDERSAIRASVVNMQSEVPKLELKAREECSPIERRFYDDAVKLVRLPAQRLEDGMDAVRDIAAVYGGYRNPANATLAGKTGTSGVKT